MIKIEYFSYVKIIKVRVQSNEKLYRDRDLKKLELASRWTKTVNNVCRFMTTNLKTKRLYLYELVQ